MLFNSFAFALFFALNMLVHTDQGDTFTFAEMRSWLDEFMADSLHRGVSVTPRQGRFPLTAVRLRGDPADPGVTGHHLAPHSPSLGRTSP